MISTDDSAILMVMTMVTFCVFSKIQDLEEELKVVCNAMKSLEIYEQEVRWWDKIIFFTVFYSEINYYAYYPFLRLFALALREQIIITTARPPRPTATTCYSAYMPRQFRLSLCPSVTRVIWIKTAERIIEILSRSDRTIILVFRHQGSLCKSDGFTPSEGAEYKRDSDCWPICGYISETVIDWSILTMEDEYKVVCSLSNGASFDDLEWPRTPVSRSQYTVKANISQTVHKIHSMFGSMLGFSGSAHRTALFAVR